MEELRGTRQHHSSGTTRNRETLACSDRFLAELQRSITYRYTTHSQQLNHTSATRALIGLDC